VGELNSVEKIDHFLKGKQDKNKIYFLLHINSFSNENKFIDYLNFSGRKINFSTQNNQFILFKFFN